MDGVGSKLLQFIRWTKRAPAYSNLKKELSTLCGNKDLEKTRLTQFPSTGLYDTLFQRAIKPTSETSRTASPAPVPLSLIMSHRVLLPERASSPNRSPEAHIRRTEQSKEIPATASGTGQRLRSENGYQSKLFCFTPSLRRRDPQPEGAR